MNSTEQDYRTPGAGFARIPAMRGSFIGCISRQCELILNGGCCPLKQSRVSLLGEEESPCVQTPQEQPRFSEFVLVNRTPSSAESAASRSNCLVFEAPTNTSERMNEHAMQRRRIAPSPSDCSYWLVSSWG